MKFPRRCILSIVVISGIAFYLSTEEIQAFSLAVQNGSFEQGGNQLEGLSGWGGAGIFKRVQPGALGQWALMLEATRRSSNVRVSQRVPLLAPLPGVVSVSGVVKGADIQSAADEGKGVAYAAVRFLDAKGNSIGYKKLSEWLNEFNWRPWSSLVRIPAGASQMELILGMEEATGKVFFDGIEIFPGFPDDQDRQNLLADGSFEYVGPLSAWDLGPGSRIIFPGLAGRGALRIHQLEFGSSSTDQDWVLPEAVGGVKRLQCSLSYKTEGVTTSQKGGGAVVSIEFFNRAGERLENKIIFGPWAGNSDWKTVGEEIAVPSATVKGRFHLQMNEAKGKAFFDKVRIESSASDQRLERILESKTETSTWISFEPQRFKGGAFDASGWLDPPAGKHGFLQARDGQFVFEDGTPIRFFGVNIQAEYALPSHREAEQMAEQLSGWGVNIVRLHHLDAPWSERNLFDPEGEDTQHLSKASLDRLDYFIAQLKARGIYVYLDLLVSRQFKKGDRVRAYGRLTNGAKMVAEFNPWIIELQKKFAKDLLTHYNPYTKTRLIDEPAIALLDLINESSLFKWPKDKGFVPEVYVKELEALAGGRPLDDEFFSEIQSRYFKEMSDFLRSLGLKIPVAGSNLPLEGKDLETNATLDFIDRHSYWDHPQWGFGDLVKFHNRSLVEADSDENRFFRLNRHPVPGKPFVAGEWNIAWPNEFRAAAPFLAAYALFQDWNGVLLFNYNGILKPRRIEGNFDISTKPEIFIQLPSLTRFFQRRDMKPGKGFHWDESKGLVWIQTEKTLAAVGRMKGEAVDLGDATFQIENPFASLILTSLDDEAVKSSRQLLLTAVARSENRGTVYNATRTLLRESGDSPILMEPVRGSLAIQNQNAPEMRVFALDASGARSKEIAVEKEKKTFKLPLGEAFVYEIFSPASS